MAGSMAYTSMAYMSAMDGPPPDFVTPDDKYTCVYCKNLLKQPMQTTCGHRLCNHCIEAMLKDKTSTMCPANDEYCEEVTVDSVYPDMATYREMTRRKVYCSYKKYGCDVQTIWSKLQAHTEKCEYAVSECKYKQYGCEEMIPMKHLSKHIASCSYFPQMCQYCNTHIAMCKMESHQALECELAPVPCPYKCGEQSVIRGKMQEHKKVCRAKPKECKFKEAGCTFLGSPSEVEAHEKDVKLHLEVALTQLVDASLKLEKQNMIIKETEKDFNAKIAALEKENRDLKSIVSFTERKTDKVEMNVANNVESVIVMEEKQKAMEVRVQSNDKKIKDLSDKYGLHDKKLLDFQSTGGGGGISTDMNTKFLQLERTIGLQDVRLAEMDLRFQCTETTSYDGFLVWKITDYARRKQDAVSGRNLSLYSQPFHSSRFGYKMCLRVYLNGDGMGKGTHMSLFFVVMKGEYDALLKWPFQQKVTMMLMDLERGIKPLTDTFRPDPSSSSFQKPRSDMNVASGCPLFVAHSVLESSTFLKDNTIFIKVHIGETDNSGL